MKVLFVTPYFPSFPFDNYGEVVLHLAKNISNNKKVEKVEILTPVYIKKYDAKYYKLNIYSPSKPLNKLGRVIWLVKMFKKLIKKNYYDIVNIQWVFPTGLVLFPVKKNNFFKTIITVRGSDVYLRYKNIFLRQILKYIFYRANAVICISNDLQEKVRKISHNRIKTYIIPSIAIDFYSFKKISKKKLEFLKRKLGVGNKKVILYVGGITKIKGADFLIRAIALLKYNYKLDDFVAIIVGDGKYKRKLMKYIFKYQLNNYILLVGKVEYEKLKYFYKIADVFVLLSRTEGLGAVLLEALYFKVPIVASNTGGIKDLVKHNENGLLVPVGDYKKAAEYLFYILTNKIKFKKKQYDDITKYNYKYMAEKSVKVYRELIIKN